MNFPEAVDFLDSLIGMGIKRGLDHTRRLAGRLGNPQEAFPSVLIAGTNGKGSTAAFLEAILREAGIRTGLFTSPHLVNVRERIRVEGRMIGETDFAASMNRVSTVSNEECDGLPTYFEALTLLAFDHFARSGVEVAVLEVGLGGRLDCTNITEPVLSVVTNIGFDHEAWLGRDLLSITHEKAGIFMKGRPALSGARRKDVAAGMEKEAMGVGALFRGPAGTIREDVAGWRLELDGVSRSFPYPLQPGRHQLDNAALAVRSALALRSLGWMIHDDAIVEGVAGTRWPGRMELVHRSPDLYIDGAHNLDGCRVFLDFVRGLPHRRKILLFAAMEDKPAPLMLETLLPAFDACWITSLPMERCAAPEALAEGSKASGVEVEPDVERAVAKAIGRAGVSGAVLTAGSIYLAGAVRQMFLPEAKASWGSGL